MSTTFSERLVQLALIATGAAILLQAWAGMPARGQAGQLLLLQAAIGAALLLAPAIPALRFPAVLAGGLGALSTLAVWWWTPGDGNAYPWQATAQLLVLALAGGELLRQHRQEARWNGLLPSRQEG